MSILCTCCSHFSWYCFISFTIFFAPVFSLIHWFFSLSSFVIPRRCLKNFICAASKCCSSLFFTSVLLNSVNSTGPNQLWSRVHVEKPIVLQLVEKFPAFYGTQRFITMSTGVSFYLQLPIIFISLFTLTYIHVCVFLTLRLLMSYIYIYIWSTYS